MKAFFDYDSVISELHFCLIYDIIFVVQIFINKTIGSDNSGTTFTPEMCKYDRGVSYMTCNRNYRVHGKAKQKKIYISHFRLLYMKSRKKSLLVYFIRHCIRNVL